MFLPLCFYLVLCDFWIYTGHFVVVFPANGTAIEVTVEAPNNNRANAGENAALLSDKSGKCH